MKISHLIGWTIYIGAGVASVGYMYYDAHYSAVAKAQQAQGDRESHQLLTWLVCKTDMETADDGKAAAETVARAIITKCGLLPAAAGPLLALYTIAPDSCDDLRSCARAIDQKEQERQACSTNPKNCIQAWQRMSLRMETDDVREERNDRAGVPPESYRRAMALAHDAMVARERALPH